NPSYMPDRINDRWPAADATGIKDMALLAEQLEYLTNRLEQMVMAPLDEIATAIDELFGERVGSEQRAILAKRYDRRVAATPVFAAARSGAIASPAVVPSQAHAREVPRHNFHPMTIGGEDDE